MKLFILAALTFSLNSFAGNLGYNCIAKNKTEETKLDKISHQLGANYLSAIKVLVVEGDQCADVVIPELRDVCEVGKYTLTIINEKNAELVLNSKTKIKLICEENRIVYPQPAGGGSN